MKLNILSASMLILIITITLGCSDGSAFEISEKAQGLEWNYTTSFSGGRFVHSSAVYNNYLYVIGGSNGTYLANVQYSRINSDGTLGTWSSTTSFTTARGGQNSIAYNGYIYIIGGYNGTNLYDVQYASINTNGSISTWSATTSFTDHSRTLPASAIFNGFLYTTGGAQGTDRYNDVIYAKINTDGTIGAWTSTTPFTTVRCAHACVTYNGYLYILGGEGNLNDVQYALINSDGSIGSWSTTTPFSTGRASFTCTVNNGSLFIFGGYNTVDGYLNDVEYAPINSDGTIGSWTTVKSFNINRSAFACEVNNDYVYIMGGNQGTTSYLNDVQYAKLIY